MVRPANLAFERHPAPLDPPPQPPHPTQPTQPTQPETKQGNFGSFYEIPLKAPLSGCDTRPKFRPPPLPDINTIPSVPGKTGISIEPPFVIQNPASSDVQLPVRPAKKKTLGKTDK